MFLESNGASNDKYASAQSSLLSKVSSVSKGLSLSLLLTSKASTENKSDACDGSLSNYYSEFRGSHFINPLKVLNLGSANERTLVQTGQQARLTPTIDSLAIDFRSISETQIQHSRSVSRLVAPDISSRYFLCISGNEAACVVWEQFNLTRLKRLCQNIYRLIVDHVP